MVSAGVARPAIISPIPAIPICSFCSLTYQSCSRGLTTLSPAFFSTSTPDCMAVDRVSPSVPPLKALSDFTCCVKFLEDSSESMMRSCSIAPSGFFAFDGTMKGSPPEAQMVP